MTDNTNTPNSGNSDDQEPEALTIDQHQVDLANKLNSAISQVAEKIKKINEQTRSQADMILSMTQSFQNIESSVGDITENATLMSENLNEAANNFITSFDKDSFLQISEGLEKIGSVVEQGLTAQNQNINLLQENLVNTLLSTKDVTSDMLNVSKDFNESLSEGSDIFVQFMNNTADVSDEFSEFAEEFSEFSETMSNLTSGFASSWKSIISGSFGVLSGIMNSLYGLVGAAAQFVKFTLTIPFTIAKMAVGFGNSIRSKLVETIQSATEDLKEHFDLSSHIGEGIREMTIRGKRMLIAFQDPTSELVKLFGFGSSGIANMIKETGTNIAAMGHFSEVFGRSIFGNDQRLRNFSKMVKGFGLSSEDIHYLALDASTNLEHVNTRMANMGVTLAAVSKEFGVDRKRLSKNFLILRKDITQFGHLSDEEIQKTTARLTQMKIKLEDAAAVFKKFSTFEDAANSVAILSQTFGMNLDAFDIIQAKNPEEIINMFRNAMLETGRSFKDLNRFEKDLLAQHTGISAESLKALMNYRRLGYTHQQAVDKMESEKPTAKQMKALKGLNSAIKEVQKIMTFDSPFKAFKEGLLSSATLTGDLKESLISLSEGYQGIYKFARSLKPETWEGLARPINYIINIMRDIFKNEEFKKGLQTAVEILAGFAGKLFDFSDPLALTQRSVQNQGREAINLAKDLEKSTRINSENLKKVVNLSGRIMGSIIKGAAIGFVSLLKLTNHGIKKAKELLKKEGENFNLIESFFGWDPGDLVGLGSQLKTSIKSLMNNSAGIISLTTWLMTGFSEIFGSILDVFIYTLASGIDEVIGTSFSKTPGAQLARTSYAPGRRSEQVTMENINKEFKGQEQIKTGDLASLINDLGDKITNITESDDEKGAKSSLTVVLKKIKDTFKADTRSPSVSKALAHRVGTLSAGFVDGKYIGNKELIKESGKRSIGQSTWKNDQILETYSLPRGPDNYAYDHNELIALQFADLIHKNKVWSKTIQSDKIDSMFLQYTDKNENDVEFEDKYKNIQFQSLLSQFGPELITLLSKSQDATIKQIEHQFLPIKKALFDESYLRNNPHFDSFLRMIYDGLEKRGRQTTTSTNNTADLAVSTDADVLSVNDLSYLHKLSAVTSSEGVLSNLMSSVSIPMAKEEEIIESKSLASETYSKVSDIEYNRTRSLSKEKAEELYRNCVKLKTAIGNETIEIETNGVLDKDVIDKLMKSMAKSNFVRILGMPAYTNGVMYIKEDAMASRCFNVASDGTAATTEILQPG